MVELIGGALIFLGGGFIGHALGRSSRKGKARAICGCSHQIGDHVDRTGACKFQYFKYGGWITCTCQVYSGPELITGFTNMGVVHLPPASEE